MSTIAATFSAMVNIKRKDGTRYDCILPPFFRRAICGAINMCLSVTVVCSWIKDCQHQFAVCRLEIVKTGVDNSTYNDRAQCATT